MKGKDNLSAKFQLLGARFVLCEPGFRKLELEVF